MMGDLVTIHSQAALSRLPRISWLGASFAAVIFGQFCLFADTPVADSLRVHLKHGRSLDATQYSVEGTTAHVSLLEGGSIAFPASLVDRIETVHNEPQPEATIPPVAEIPIKASPSGLSSALPSTGQPGAECPGVEPQDDSIEAMIRSAAQRHQLEPDLLAAVIAVESGYQPSAVSPKGAQGLMQLMPGTAKDLLVTNPFDPRQNIEAGATYLRQLLDQHNGSFVDALAAYNAGSGRVARYNGVPPYRETIAYINKVLKRYRSPQAVPTQKAVTRAGR